MQGMQAAMLALLGALVLQSTALGADRASEFAPDQASLAAPGQLVAQPEDARFILYGMDGSLQPVFRIHRPGASFIKLRFREFRIPEGVTVEVSSPDTGEAYRYANSTRENRTFDRRLGEDGVTIFSAMSISGDTADVRVLGRRDRFIPGIHALTINGILQGLSRPEPAVPVSRLQAAGKSPPSTLQSTCGINERYDAACWIDSHPDEYDRSIPVAALVTSSGEECTAWRVGPDNRLFTAQHCVGSQDDVTGAEVWFNYQTRSCGGSSTETPVKVSGKDFLAADATLDYGLFTVNDFSRVGPFGFLGLEVREASQGEGIYIPQHGLGRPKQIAIESDMNASGWCEVDSASHRGYAPASDIGYYCDTTTSSSGAPVIASASGKAIALHHLGGCMNSGAKFSLIWPQVAGFFGGQVPRGDGSQWGESVNARPEARFSYTCTGLDCVFDANGSDDPDGSIVSYAWQLGDGNTANGTLIEHRFAESGAYTVKLTVRDNDSAASTVSEVVQVESPNRAPEANFSVACEYNQCTFNGGDSSDPDGIITAWSWTFGDGATASGSEVDHTYASAGTRTVKLVVTDEKGAEDSLSRSVSVDLPNRDPTATFEFDCDELACSFDASDSRDPDGQILEYYWTFGDGGSALGVSAHYAFAVAGTHVVSLRVTDDRGATDVKSRSLQLAEQNLEPVALLSVDCSGRTCEFDGSGSYDPDGSIRSFAWSLGDGSLADSPTARHEFASDGQFTVRLTVEDNRGARNSSSKRISVRSANASPVPDFEFNCAELRCTFDASPSSDPDGVIDRFEWSLGDGRISSGEQLSHDYAGSGTYPVTLSVTDDAGTTASVTRELTVNAVPPIKLKVATLEDFAASQVVLKWTGAQTDQVDIYRDGKLVSHVLNIGVHVDKYARRFLGKTRYQLCEPGAGRCSPEVLSR